MTRARHGVYRDPVDLIWLQCVADCGLDVVVDPSVYASFDGRRTLSVCPPSDYDPDDSLAQLLLHELCHALVQGPAGRRTVDWGLDNTDDDASALQEHACHRLQAALLDRHGLRDVLAVTTDWRPYWDALPDDPLAHGDDPAIARARDAWADARRGPWSGPIDRALRATADIADLLRSQSDDQSLWARARPRHPRTRRALHGDPTLTCGACAWRTQDGRCLAASDHDEQGPLVADDDPACLQFEVPHTASDCGTCGACCHRGFHAVAFGVDEPLAASPPPEAIPDPEVGYLLPRPDGRCVLLQAGTPWRCARYAARPQACRDFAVDGVHCLTARRRVGLSRR